MLKRYSSSRPRSDCGPMDLGGCCRRRRPGSSSRGTAPPESTTAATTGTGCRGATRVRRCVLASSWPSFTTVSAPAIATTITDVVESASTQQPCADDRSGPKNEKRQSFVSFQAIELKLGRILIKTTRTMRFGHHVIRKYPETPLKRSICVENLCLLRQT